MSLLTLPDRLRRASDATVAAFVGCATFVYGFVFAYPRQWSQGLLINDEMWYAHLARNVYMGYGYVSNTLYPMQASSVDGFPGPEAFKQAGYPLLTALAWTITGPSSRAMVIVALIGFAISGGLVYALGRAVAWSRGASLLLAGLVVFNPPIVSLLTSAIPESWYFAVFLAVVLLLLRKTSMSAAASGAAHAALLILKGHGIIYVPLFGAYLLFAGGRRRWRLALTYSVALVAATVVASVSLPDGSVQLFRSGGNYALAFLTDMDGYPSNRQPYYELQPPDAVEYILDHPLEYAEKYLRMVSRTKFIVTGLAGPALGGVMFPLLLGSVLLLGLDAGRRGRLFPEAAGTRPDAELLLFAAVIGGSLAFFWAIYLTDRFLLQTYPLMLLIVFEAASRFRPFSRAMAAPLQTALVGLALVYCLAYPGAAALWRSYRDPHAFLGRQLAVRFADYSRVARDVEGLPEDAVLASDMANEINWLTGRSTVFLPLSEAELPTMIDKFGITALYEHPLFPRDWPSIAADFRLVDDTNGRFWVRRTTGQEGR